MKEVDLISMIECVTASFHINLSIVKSPEDEKNCFDLGLREHILKCGRPNDVLHNIYAGCGPFILHHVIDRYDSEYDLFALPEDMRSCGDYILIGPYRKEYMDDFRLNRLIQKCGLPISLTSGLRDYFCEVPIVMDSGSWDELLLSIVRMCYDGQEIKKRLVELKEDESMGWKEDLPEDTLVHTKMLEDRYRMENELLHAIASGDADTALRICRKFSSTSVSRRFKDPNRDRRNILITSNAIYRKAAENGCVHPVHIDRLSSGFAKKIETVCTEREASRLALEMVRKYCLLVRNFSLKGHSAVIQKIVNHIDLNLAHDLSLKRLSEEYCVNASYLSTLFKKEMGQNLIEYLTDYRMKQAKELLKDSTLNINEISDRVGYPDSRYFSKLFKKCIGITPSEFRKLYD